MHIEGSRNLGIILEFFPYTGDLFNPKTLCQFIKLYLPCQSHAEVLKDVLHLSFLPKCNWFGVSVIHFGKYWEKTFWEFFLLGKGPTFPKSRILRKKQILISENQKYFCFTFTFLFSYFSGVDLISCGLITIRGYIARERISGLKNFPDIS